MITFLANSINTDDESITKELNGLSLAGVGVSQELPENVLLSIAESEKIMLFQSTLAFDQPDFRYHIIPTVQLAEKLNAKAITVGIGEICDAGHDVHEFVEVIEYCKSVVETHKLTLYLTNSRNYIGNRISSEKICKLCKETKTEMIWDIGISHAMGSALEDWYDLKKHIAGIFLNDCKDGKIMLQPGYGTAPISAVGKDIFIEDNDVQIYITGARYQNASLKTVFFETDNVLRGNVYLSPAGRTTGINPDTGRILLRTQNNN